MEEAFLHCGIQWKRFFPLWDTMEKKHTTCRMIFLNFKCLIASKYKFLEKFATGTVKTIREKN
jgi:hypothetical protein